MISQSSVDCICHWKLSPLHDVDVVSEFKSIRIVFIRYRKKFKESCTVNNQKILVNSIFNITVRAKTNLELWLFEMQNQN